MISSPLMKEEKHKREKIKSQWRD